jgi:hypothetical protein
LVEIQSKYQSSKVWSGIDGYFPDSPAALVPSDNYKIVAAWPVPGGSLGRICQWRHVFPFDCQPICTDEIAGRPAAATWPSGREHVVLAVSWGLSRIDVVARGEDDELWHRSYDGSAWTK